MIFTDNRIRRVQATSLELTQIKEEFRCWNCKGKTQWIYMRSSESSIVVAMYCERCRIIFRADSPMEWKEIEDNGNFYLL